MTTRGLEIPTTLKNLGTEMKARVLKHMTEMVLPILMEPTDPSDNRGQEVVNVFNRFATALLQGCEDLDANEVWLYTGVGSH